MAWVKTVKPEEATGVLDRVYLAAEKRAGYLPNLTRLQSLRPETMAIGVSLYRQLMDASTGINSRQRVLIATVVSKINGCHY